MLKTLSANENNLGNFNLFNVLSKCSRSSEGETSI